MRCGEAFGLHVEDLDLANGRICIRRSVWEGEEVTVKTRQGYRAVTIDPILTGMLAAHLEIVKPVGYSKPKPGRRSVNGMHGDGSTNC